MSEPTYIYGRATMGTPYYTLGANGEPVPEPNVAAWGLWYNDPTKRRIAFDKIDTPAGPVEVSTVFLGLDHAFGGGPPLLWETMVFEGPMDGEMERYSSRADAVAGHAAMCERVRSETADAPVVLTAPN